MTGPVRRLILLAVIGALLVGLVAGGLALLDWQPIGLAREIRLAEFIASLCVAGALWLLAVVVVLRGRLPPEAIWLVVGVAVAMRLLTLSAPPVLSSDIYRYVWDGRVQRAGINPYRYIPNADALAFLRDDAVYPQINRADYAPTVYPPTAQAIFALAAFVSPGVFGMKLIITAFDALAMVALIVLLRAGGRDPAQLLIYAWLPLPVWEFAGNGHIDGAAAGLLMLALLASVRGRSLWTGVLLAGAALTKFLPVVVLPAFWRPRDWRLPLAFTATVIALYLPYVGGGTPGAGISAGLRWRRRASRTAAGFSCSSCSATSCRCLTGSPCSMSCWCWRAWRAGRALRLHVSAARSAGARVLRRRRGRRSSWRRAAGRPVAALSVVFRLAGAAGLPGAAAERALDPGCRTAAGTWILRVSGSARAGLRPCHRPRGVSTCCRRAGAAPTRKPSQERLMTATALKDPRRYFEAVQPRATEANAPPVCLYLEVTNRCNLLCETCPRTFEELEPPADMSWELFTSIVDQVPDVARVVLHGVGEPMLVRRCRA